MREDPTSPKWMYKMYEETFRISKLTDYKLFQRNVCDYWGIDMEKFSNFFDDNGDKVDLEVVGAGPNPSMSKIVSIKNDPVTKSVT